MKKMSVRNDPFWGGSWVAEEEKLTLRLTTRQEAIQRLLEEHQADEDGY